MNALAPRIACLFVAWLVVLVPAGSAAAEKRPYNLKPTDLKQPVLWGATCETPEGLGLSFGGQDQTAEDGVAHTRVREGGQWKDIYADLRARNPLQSLCDRCRALEKRQKDVAAAARRLYFQGLPAADAAEKIKSGVLAEQQKIVADVEKLGDEEVEEHTSDEGAAARQAGWNYELVQRGFALSWGLDQAETWANEAASWLARGELARAIRAMDKARTYLAQAAEALDCEPPPRALSPIAFDPRTRLFVLFGGDHLDYLTNDTWVFDPAARRWQQRRPAAAPPPRANHKLAATGDGKLRLTGGYTYTSNTDYCGGQYADLDDGEWTYDVARTLWTGAGERVVPHARVYRTGPFHPDYYLAGPPPVAAAFQERLKGLPANTWVSVKPPHLPELNRDWGSAVLDADRDMVLRFSGGHSAHGGTDVLHFHLATGRWELPFPVEFPLGQIYSNTDYPDGYNFNRRPWVTGHTYQSYGCDPLLKQMVFAGRERHSYFYDPDAGDWAGRKEKPEGMKYDSCFYTITICQTPRGLAAWTAAGRLFRFRAEDRSWQELRLAGEKLPGAVVDNSTVVYDSKRDRLLMAQKGYGDQHRFDGRLWAVDLGSLEVKSLAPKGMKAAAKIPYLCQIRYDIEHDLLLVGATLPPDAAGLRRTPAYDCEGNRWVSLRITGEDPSGREGRNVSLGLMYDPARKLFWAVDTHSHVFVLRLDPGAADVADLR